jgi:hypothetical protein
MARILHFNHSVSTMKKITDVEQLRKAQWKEVEREIVLKLRALHALVDKMESNQDNNKMANEAIAPLLGYLGYFCSCIELKGDFIVLKFRPKEVLDACQASKNN